MDRVLTFAVGAIFVGGGAMLAKDGWDDQKNTIETVAFGLLGVGFGLFLCYQAVFGLPDWL